MNVYALPNICLHTKSIGWCIAADVWHFNLLFGQPKEKSISRYLFVYIRCSHPHSEHFTLPLHLMAGWTFLIIIDNISKEVKKKKPEWKIIFFLLPFEIHPQIDFFWQERFGLVAFCKQTQAAHKSHAIWNGFHGGKMCQSLKCGF